MGGGGRLGGGGVLRGARGGGVAGGETGAFEATGDFQTLKGAFGAE